MSKELVISAPAHERRVAILEDGQLVEIYIEREKEFALVGSIYKGRVTRVLPGMQSAFVDIGLDGDAFLYVSDVFENLEEYEPAGTHVDAPAPRETVPTQGLPQGESAPEERAAEQAREAEAYPAAPAEAPFVLPGEVLSKVHGAAPAEPHASESDEDAQPQEISGNREQQPPRQGFQPRYNGGQNRGNDFRGGDRGGRFGRRRRGGRGQDRGRNLPPSKYASPQGQGAGPSQGQGREPRGFEPRGPEQRRPDAGRFAPPQAEAVGGEEPILLPGESLAKYRGRPATMLPPDEPEGRAPAAAEETSETIVAAPPVVQTQPPASPAPRPRRFLPRWLLADTEPESAAETAKEEAAPEAAPPTRVEPELTEDDVAALSAQLAEAKHEEAEEEAEGDTVAGEVEEENNHAAAEENHAADASFVADALGESILEAREEEELAAEEAHEEAHEEAVAEAQELAEAQATAAQALPLPAPDEEILLPGETRSAMGRGPSIQHPIEEPLYERQPYENKYLEGQPREERGPRDSARVGGDPRSRFQRPQRGGRDRGGDRGRGGPRHGRRDRGGRARFERRGHGGPAGAPQRRPQLISEMLKAGQEIIVQIAKEPLGKKGARITSHIALPGRFLVYMPTIDHVGVSRKIAAAENRSRLRRLVSEAKGSYPGGFIVRTAAGDATDEEVRADIEFLGNTWNTAKKNSEERRAPSLLHRDLNLVERILRDYVNDEYTAIWVDSEEEFGKIVEFVSRFQPKMVSRVKLYTKEAPIFEEFGIQHDLDKALRPKVWLKSGGYIVINHTEALVAIDVNTGKYVGKGSTRLEDTIVKTNVEAVKEIVRQIRLRDLGGIIVVDFIDMEERRNREKVMFALQQALDEDKAPSKALGFNEFGLVCITRKRTKQALERVLCQPCPSCSGSGMVKSIPTLCYEIQAEARKMAIDHEEPNLTIRVHPEIAKALKTRESMLMDELEQTAHKHVIIQSDPTLHWEQYDIF